MRFLFVTAIQIVFVEGGEFQQRPAQKKLSAFDTNTNLTSMSLGSANAFPKENLIN